MEAVFGRFDSKFDGAFAKKQSDEMADLHKRVKIATTVNCWHINNHESDAMWQLYLEDNEGIAVKTRKINLYKALSNSSQKIGISKVRYIDYETGIWFHPTEFPTHGYNIMTPLIHKRLEFKHECELRLYHHDYTRENSDYWDSQSNQIGEFVLVDVNALVEAVIFHPTADKKVKEKIVALVKAYGYDFRFQESKMSIDPIY